jgi:nucleoside-diphosphate-sugar epimerase
MKVLVTCASSLLGRSLVDILNSTHRLRLVDTEPTETTAEFCQGDIRDPQTAFRVCEGMEAVVHLCELPHGPSAKPGWEHEALDLATRGTYNLFKAAAEAGVKSAVFVSTLKLYLKYPPEYVIAENWKPRPDPNDAFQLAKYLGELTVREFARAESIYAVVLRVGNIVLEEECQGLPFDPLWVDARDAARAVERVLISPVHHSWKQHRWWAYHLIVDNPRSRFASAKGVWSSPHFRTTRNFKAWEESA